MAAVMPRIAVLQATLLLILLAGIPVQAAEPVPALVWSSAGSGIGRYSMDIASDGTIFVAAEVEDVAGISIVVVRSDDGGATWTQWSGLGLPGYNYTDPSIEVAEGTVDRLFVAYRVQEAVQFPEWGAIRVAYHALDAPSAIWTVNTIIQQEPYPPAGVRIYADDALRADYGVFVLFGANTKFFFELALSRSLDQGTSWQPYYLTYLDAGFFSTMQYDLAFGADDVFHVILASHRGVHCYRVTDRGAESGDWTRTGTFTTSGSRRAPQIVARPGADQVFALYTRSADKVMNVLRSDDGGLHWNTESESSTVEARDGELELTPLGYRVAGYVDPNLAVVGEPVIGIDPTGDWNLNPIPGAFSSDHLSPVQIAWDASRGGAAFLAHASEGATENLMFWGEWFQDAASVPDVARELQMRAWPNPANEQVELSLPVAEPGPVQLSVFDVRGRTVFRRVEHLDRGRVIWDLRDEDGRRVPGGVYLLDLRGTTTVGRSHLIVR